MTNNFVLLLGW